MRLSQSALLRGNWPQARSLRRRGSDEVLDASVGVLVCTLLHRFRKTHDRRIVQKIEEEIFEIMPRAFVLMIYFAGLLSAQAVGSISGTVKDPSGAVVGGAQITATSAGTGATRSTTANAEGYFLISTLQP